MVQPAAERTVHVAPERLRRWLDGFSERHGQVTCHSTGHELTLAGADGALATIDLVWGPLPAGTDPLVAVVESFGLTRRVGVLLVRRRAHAVGIFEGPHLVAGRHGSHYVQGRTKAGGWSQQRYARRREHQADRSFASAATDVATILLPQADSLTALITGGDRGAVAAVLADPRFEPLRRPRLHTGFGVFAVPDPNATVLAEFGQRFRAAPIRLNDLA